MKTDDNPKLEALIRQELRHLPDLQAPETLFHRVMLEVHSRARQPWWRRSWHGWPPAMQAMTLITLLGLATGVSYSLGQTFQEIPYEALEVVFVEWLGPLARLWEFGETMMKAVSLVMKSGGQQIMLYGSLFILAIYAACIGLGTAVARAVTNRAENGRI